jgi:hypothetical protein
MPNWATTTTPTGDSFGNGARFLARLRASLCKVSLVLESHNMELKR